MAPIDISNLHIDGSSELSFSFSLSTGTVTLGFGALFLCGPLTVVPILWAVNYYCATGR